MPGVMRCRRGITFYCTENGDPRKLVYVPVGFVKRFISISLADSESIGEPLDDTGPFKVNLKWPFSGLKWIFWVFKIRLG